MKSDLLKLKLNDQDKPVISFTHKEKCVTLEQQLLGALIRQISQKGIELHLVRQYTDAEEKPIWEYEIRAIQPYEID